MRQTKAIRTTDVVDDEAFMASCKQEAVTVTVIALKTPPTSNLIFAGRA